MFQGKNASVNLSSKISQMVESVLGEPLEVNNKIMMVVVMYDDFMLYSFLMTYRITYLTITWMMKAWNGR